jgi:hypothetical protein
MGEYPSTAGVAGHKKEDGTDPKLNKQQAIIANGGKPEGFYDPIPENKGNVLTNSSPLQTGTNQPGMMPGMIPQGPMSPAQQIQAQQLQYQQMKAQMSQATSGGNILDEEGGGSTPTMGGPPSMASGGPMGGIPVNLQAQVVSADLASRTLIVRMANSPATQTVIVAPEALMSAFQPGQSVAITGVSDPTTGVIQASSVVQIGH